MGPNYNRPTVDVPSSFSTAGIPDPSKIDFGEWWKALGDPVLDTLISRSMAGNLDIQQAASRVKQARRANEAARARTEATVWQQRDVEVLLASEVANTYLQFRALQRRTPLPTKRLGGCERRLA